MRLGAGSHNKRYPDQTPRALQYVAAHAGFPERSEEVRVTFDSDLAVTFGGSLHFHRRVVPYELAEALAGDWINA
jgi:hypothetical protein